LPAGRRRVFTGRQAVTAKLIDTVGGEEKAIDWLETEKKIGKDSKIVDWDLPLSADPTGLGFAVTDGVLRALGLGTSARRTKLDGLLVLWHPQF
jgi:protease-4